MIFVAAFLGQGGGRSLNLPGKRKGVQKEGLFR